MIATMVPHHFFDILGGEALLSCPSNSSVIRIPTNIHLSDHVIIYSPAVVFSFLTFAVLSAAMCIFTIIHYNQLIVLNRRVTHRSLNNEIWAWFFGSIGLSCFLEAFRYGLNLSRAMGPPFKLFYSSVHPKVINDWMLLTASLARALAILFLGIGLIEQKRHRSGMGDGTGAEQSYHHSQGFLDRMTATSGENAAIERVSSRTSHAGSTESVIGTEGESRPLLGDVFERETQVTQSFDWRVLLSSYQFWILGGFVLRLFSLYILINPPHSCSDSECIHWTWIPAVLLTPLNYSPSWALRLMHTLMQSIQSLLTVWISYDIATSRISQSEATDSSVEGSGGSHREIDQETGVRLPSQSLIEYQKPDAFGPTTSTRILLVVSVILCQLHLIEPSVLSREFYHIASLAGVSAPQMVSWACVVPPWWWVDTDRPFLSGARFASWDLTPVGHGWASWVDLLCWIGFAGVVGLYRFVKAEYCRNAENWIIATISRARSIFFAPSR